MFSWPTRLLASRKTVAKVPHQVLAKRANCFSFFFFLLLLLSDGLAQRRLNPSWWFSHETAAFYTEQCTSPSLFRNLRVFTMVPGGCSCPLNNYGFFSHAIFSFVRMRDHLATNVIITQDCWIRSVLRRCVYIISQLHAHMHASESIHGMYDVTSGCSIACSYVTLCIAVNGEIGRWGFEMYAWLKLCRSDNLSDRGDKQETWTVKTVSEVWESVEVRTRTKRSCYVYSPPASSVQALFLHS